MGSFRLDVRRLRQDLRETSEVLTALKARLRERGQPRGGPSVQRKILELRGQATLLCTLRAHHRGKLHGRPKMMIGRRFYDGDATFNKAALEAQAEWLVQHGHFWFIRYADLATAAESVYSARLALTMLQPPYLRAELKALPEEARKPLPPREQVQVQAQLPVTAQPVDGVAEMEPVRVAKGGGSD